MKAEMVTVTYVRLLEVSCAVNEIVPRARRGKSFRGKPVPPIPEQGEVGIGWHGVELAPHRVFGQERRNEIGGQGASHERIDRCK